MPVFLKILRPYQWTKNLFVISGFAFAIFDIERQISLKSSLLSALLGTAIFCLISGVIYIINDLHDIEQDRAHPYKKNRPLPAGKITPMFALIEAIILTIISLIISTTLGNTFFICITTYLALQLLYTFLLKRIPFCDVITIALGFVIRVYTGTVAAKVRLSPWILICTFLLTLLIALCKRRGEIILLGNKAPLHRQVLKTYSIKSTNILIRLASLTTVASYSAWTFAQSTINKFGSQYIFFTVFPVILAISRFLSATENSPCASHPEQIVVRDKPLILIFILYVIAFIIAIKL